jgi:anti-sigma-K factor RskA
MAEQNNQPNTHVEDRIDAYALGILEDEALAEVETHLEQCAHCRHLLQQAREVVGLLALAPRQVAPPPRLKQRILSRIAQEGRPGGAPAAPEPAPRLSDAPQEHEPDPTVGVPLPAPTVERQRFADTLRHWFAERRSAPPPVAEVPGREQTSEQQLQLILRLLHAPGAALWDLAGTAEAPNARALLLGSPQESEAVLVVSGLEPLPPERDYQLWFLREGQPVGSAVFDVHGSGEGQLVIRAPRQIGHYDLAAITPEPAGGSPGPTGPIMIAGQLKAA